MATVPRPRTRWGVLHAMTLRINMPPLPTVAANARAMRTARGPRHLPHRCLRAKPRDKRARVARANLQTPTPACFSWTPPTSASMAPIDLNSAERTRDSSLSPKALLRSSESSECACDLRASAVCHDKQALATAEPAPGTGSWAAQVKPRARDQTPSSVPESRAPRTWTHTAIVSNNPDTTSRRGAARDPRTHILES